MHTQFIFLFFLHNAIANHEYPLFKTNNLFSPSSLVPVTPVASTSAVAESVSASQGFETRDGNGRFVHDRKRQEAPFPIKPSYRLIFNDGVPDSVPVSNEVPKEGFLKSGYINLLPRTSRGSVLVTDTRGVVRITKQFDPSTPVDNAVSVHPEPVGPDERDPTRTARPEEKRSLESKLGYQVRYSGINRRGDIYSRNHLGLAGTRENSELVGRRDTTETKDRYAMLHSSNQMTPRATRSEPEINEGPNQKGQFDESHFRCLYSTLTANNLFRPPLSEHECLRDNVPSLPVDPGARGGEAVSTTPPPRTTDLSFIPLLPRNVIQSVSSAGVSRGEVYRLQRGDDGAMRSILVKRSGAGSRIHRGLGRPTRSIEVSQDGEVYVVDAVRPVGGSGEAGIRPVDSITILGEVSPISGKIRPVEPVSTLGGFGSEAVGSLGSLSVLETADDWEAGSMGSFHLDDWNTESMDPFHPDDWRAESMDSFRPDDWRAESMESFHPFEFGKGGGPRGDLGGGPDKKSSKLGETNWQPLARSSDSVGGVSRVSPDPSPNSIYAIELGDDGGMRSRIVERRSNRVVGNTADFEPILPGSSLDIVNPAGKDEGSPWPSAGAQSIDDRVSINSPLMVDQNGRAYHRVIQARSTNEAHVSNLPGPVPPTGIWPISTDEIGQLLSEDLENSGCNCLNMGDRIASGSTSDSASCAIQGKVDGKPNPRNLKRRSVDGSDCIVPLAEGNPIKPIPDLTQAIKEKREVPGASGEAGASGATNMTLLFHSMTPDKLVVVLPLVMFGTLLLVLVVFGMAFCCLRQAEETYHINIQAVGGRRRRKRNSRRRRKNNASTGAAEEGAITVPPGAPTSQPEVGDTDRGWFFQRWYSSLRGDATHKAPSFPGVEVISQRNPSSGLMWVRGLDGGQDIRDPSYILDTVSDRLQQTRGRPRLLSTIWSDGGRESSATANAFLATGRDHSGEANLNTTMGQGMYGAEGDTSIGFCQGSVSTTENTGLSGNPSNDLTLSHSSVEGFTDAPEPGGQWSLGSEGAFRMLVDQGLSIPGTEDASESSELGKDGRVRNNGTILGGRGGDTRRSEDEAEASITVEDC